MKNIAAVTVILLFAAGCAQIVPPTGGPRDTMPPSIKQISLMDSSLGFSDPEIVIEFDEVVANKNLAQHFLFSPFLKNDAKIKWEYRKVRIDLSDDNLRPQTSYTLTINEIADINEGNKMGDTTLIFSTGDYMDTLELSGQIKNADGEGNPNEMLVYLYSAEDSFRIIEKERPLYYASVSASGRFRFQALPPGKYRLYALADKNKNYRYDLSTERVAFDTSIVDLRQNQNHPNTLYSFVVIKENADAKNTKRSGSTSSRGGTLDRTPSSGRSGTDTSSSTLSTDTQVNTTRRRLGFSADSNRAQDLYQDFKITSDIALDSVQTDLISLGDTSAQQIEKIDITIDSLRTTLSIRPRDGWKSDHVYRLYIKNQALRDTSDNGNSTQSLFFRTKDASNYATAIFRFSPEDSSEQYIVQLTVDGTDSSYVLNPDRGYNIDLMHLNPGKIKVRYFLDRDRNGEYTNGNLAEMKQPEILHTVPEEYEIKESWDHVYSINEMEESDSESTNSRSGTRK